MFAQRLVRRPCQIRRIGSARIRYDHAAQIAQQAQQDLLLSVVLNAWVRYRNHLLSIARSGPEPARFAAARCGPARLLRKARSYRGSRFQDPRRDNWSWFVNTKGTS